MPNLGPIFLPARAEHTLRGEQTRLRLTSGLLLLAPWDQTLPSQGPAATWAEEGILTLSTFSRTPTEAGNSYKHTRGGANLRQAPSDPALPGESHELFKITRAVWKISRVFASFLNIKILAVREKNTCFVIPVLFSSFSNLWCQMSDFIVHLTIQGYWANCAHSLGLSF